MSNRQWITADTSTTTDFETVVEMMQAANKLGMGYRLVHDLTNNPEQPKGIEHQRFTGIYPVWHLTLFFYSEQAVQDARTAVEESRS